MGAASISGSLTFGPQPAGGTFPNGSSSLQLGLIADQKPFDAASPAVTRSFDSPSAFASLGVVAESGPVVRCTVFYLRCESKLRVRVTFDDGVGGTYQSTFPLLGTILIEPPDDEAIVSVEVKGTSTIEYCAAGTG